MKKRSKDAGSQGGGTGDAVGKRRRLNRVGAEFDTGPLAVHLATGPASPVWTVATTFSLGDVIADRYRVTRLVARGGMGEVYEVEDQEFNERVALKAVRAEIAGDPRVTGRFKREIQLARRVTHPNVCRIFDVGYHRLGDAPGISFMTMELLEGETLTQRMARQGTMVPSEALIILRQIAAGLDAAHQAGVIHGDFSAGNVILVPQEDGSPRAVITDFGLSRAISTDASSEGEIAGSPAYIAPEQVAGFPPTAASDLFSLGVIAYEMITGTLPWSGDHAMDQLVARIEREPTPPRQAKPDLDDNWAMGLERALARTPKGRFDSAAELVAALGGERRWPRRRLVAVGAVAAVVAMAAAGYLARRQTLPTGPPRRPSVATLGFKNLSPQPEATWVGTALTQMLAAELGASETLRMIPSEEVARAKIDLGVTEADSYGPETVSRVRSRLGVDHLVVGSYWQSSSGELRVDVRLQDTRSGEIKGTFVDNGRSDALPEIVGRVGRHLRDTLGVIAAPAQRMTAPPDPKAMRLYAQGLAALHAFDTLKARALLERAIEADRGSPQAHSALSESLHALGYDVRAREEASRAMELSSSLPREERLLVEARYYSLILDAPKVIERYSELHALFPDEPEYLARLVNTLAANRQMDAAQGAFARLLDHFPNDPRLDFSEAALAGASHDYLRAARAYARAAQKGRAHGAMLLVARARLSEAEARANLPELDAAVAAANEAKQIFAEAGDRGGVAESLGTLASILRTQGRIAPAVAVMEERMAIKRALGNEKEIAGVRVALAPFYLRQGKMGPTAELLDPAIAYFRRIDDVRQVVMALLWRARLAMETTDLPRARTDVAEAQSLAVTQSPRLRGFVLGVAGELRLIEGDSAGARRLQSEAFAIRSGIMIPGGQTRLAFAEIALEQGQLGEAETRAGEAAAAFAEAGASGEAATAEAARARILAAAGRLADARKALGRAETHLVRVDAFDARINVSLARIEVLLAAGGREDAGRAKAEIETLLTAVDATRMLHSTFRLRLALGRAERILGEPQADQRLAVLRDEATGKGYLLIARKAERARTSH